MSSLISLLERPKVLASLTAAATAAAAKALEAGHPIAMRDGEQIILLYRDGRRVPLWSSQRNQDELE
jgi:hypothetical protein